MKNDVKNVVLNEYLSTKEVFADIFNVMLFKGEQTLNKDNLSDMDSNSDFMLEVKGKMKKVPFHRTRDVVKKSALGVEFVILAVENQSKINYAMPARDMLYDAISYSEQLSEIKLQHEKDKDLSGDEFISKFSKNDKLMPVITLVIYYNDKPWDGPIELFDMLPNTEQMNICKKYTNNSKINLLWAYDAKNIRKYQTGIKDIFGLLKYYNEGKSIEDYAKTHKNFENLNEKVFEVLQVILDEDNLSINKEKNEKGGVNMCQALTKLREEGINLGRTEGINLGRTEGINLGRTEGINLGRTEGIKYGEEQGTIKLCIDLGMKKDQIKEKLMKMLNMTELEAEESITKYLEK